MTRGFFRRNTVAVPLRRWLLAGIAVAALVTVLGSAWLDWAASGERSRTSFELLRVARRLDVLSAGWQRIGAAAWFVMPAAVGASLVAVATHRFRLLAGIAFAVGALALALGLAVKASSLTAEVGSVIAMWSGTVSMLSAVALAAEGSRR